MRTAGKIMLLVVVLLTVTRIVSAYNRRSAHAFDLHVLAVTFWAYEDANKSFPTDDICDAQGKPLLSWRVRLLPFWSFGSSLYKEFHLNEPWDSVHNRQLIAKIPRAYHAFNWEGIDEGKTRVVALRGPNTFFGSGKPRGRDEIRNSLATTVILVEADAEHAPIWTKPEDLTYDPANPARGLADTWSTGFFPEQGGYVILADKEVRIIRKSADPEMLRSLFSIEKGELVDLEVPWYAVLDQEPLGSFIVTSLLMSLPFIAGSLAVAWRLAKGKPISPGEMLLFIIGMQQFAFVLAFLAFYRYDVLPTLYSSGHHQQSFWLLAIPTAAGALGALLAVIRFWSVPRVRAIFAVLLLLSSLCILDRFVGYQHWHPEESLTLIGHPWTFAGTALALFWASLLDVRVREVRPRWNILCIAASVVPLLWFLLRCAIGVAEYRQPFGQILD